MISRFLLLITLVFTSSNCFSQFGNTSIIDTTDYPLGGKLTVEGYLDVYYAFDFNKPIDERPYFVSMSRQNEFTINLAYVAVKYNSQRLRGSVIPGIGSYMNANYATESGTFKNVVEASAGILLLKSKSLWLDFGIFGSPYTNESAISKDHLVYTRSFAPEYVPYYLCGVKLSMPITEKIKGYLFLINGWQQIKDVNSGKSIGTQIEYRPNNNILINWNTYVGNENSPSSPDYSTRYFTDVYALYKKGKWSSTACAYLGFQDKKLGSTTTWWQANAILQYSVNNKLSVSGRIEYFHDDKATMITPITGISSFRCFSNSLGLNVKPLENAMLRCEWRTFYSPLNEFIKNSNPVNTANLIIANATVWF